MSEQDQRGGQPESTDENAPDVTGRATTGPAKRAGEKDRTTEKAGGRAPAKK